MLAVIWFYSLRVIVWPLRNLQLYIVVTYYIRVTIVLLSHQFIMLLAGVISSACTPCPTPVSTRMSLFPKPWLRVGAWTCSRSPAKLYCAPSRTRLPFRLFSVWADRLQTPHALHVEWAQWITLWTECFHCEDAAFSQALPNGLLGLHALFAASSHECRDQMHP